MSPTENDLRAALHDGEGDGPDVDRIVSSGRLARAQRRGRLLSAAAVTVVVAGLGAGAAAVWGRDGGGSSGSQRAAGGSAQQNSSVYNAMRGAATPTPGAPENMSRPSGTSGLAGAAAGSAAVACPSSLPRYLLPGGGSPGQFGSDGPLFGTPVASVVVCAYGPPASALGTHHGAPARLELTGDRAAELVTSLESASTSRIAQHCPARTTPAQNSLALIGVGTSGSPVATVTATLSDPPCSVEVTNGTAVRYAWAPPADLQPVLMSLTPLRAPASPATLQPTPSGRMHGSPINS